MSKGHQMAGLRIAVRFASTSALRSPRSGAGSEPIVRITLVVRAEGKS